MRLLVSLWSLMHSVTITTLLSEWTIIKLRCVTYVFIAPKFAVTIFSSYYKIWTWLDWSIFIRIPTTKRDWKFLLIWVFNNRKYLLDLVKIYSAKNLILKYILSSYIIFLVRFCVLTHLFPMQHFSTPWKHQKTVRLSIFSGGGKRVYWEQNG